MTPELDRVVAAPSLTTSIAPSAARMPQRIAPPSNAGPAGAAVERIRSPSLSTISQLVPTSMNSRVRLSRSMPVASMPATMSPPTYAPSAGKSVARARGCRASPRSEASTTGGCGDDMMNGATPSGSGSMPSTQRGHRRVAGDRHLVDVGRVDAALGADLDRQRGQGLRRRALQPAEGLGVHHRGADPGDHVAAERLLLVEHRGHRDRRAGGDVEQGGDHGGGAEVEGDGVLRLRGVARLDVDQRLVDDHGGDLEVGRAQHRRQPAQHVQVGDRLEVVDRLEQPVQVGALVGEGGLVELDVPLLDRRAAGSPGGRRRRSRPWVGW